MVRASPHEKQVPIASWLGSGARVYEYVTLLNKLEQELRKDVGENVLLVPAAPD